MIRLAATILGMSIIDLISTINASDLTINHRTLIDLTMNQSSNRSYDMQYDSQIRSFFNNNLSHSFLSKVDRSTSVSS